MLKLGAQMFRWPVSASSVNAIILEEAVANAGFEAPVTSATEPLYLYHAVDGQADQNPSMRGCPLQVYGLRVGV